MSAPGPRRKWMSQSAHPKEGLRKYPGKRYDKLSDRDGNPTHRNNRDGTCVVCGTDVPAEAGWLLILPFRNGQNNSAYAIMCRPCATPKQHETPPTEADGVVQPEARHRADGQAEAGVEGM